MMPPQPGPSGAQPPRPPPPNPELQKAQAQLQQIEQQLTQIQENMQVLQLLRDEKTRGYRIEIETDSTIEPDEQAEKKSRIEFTEVCGKFLGEALPILQVMPQAAPMFEQVFLFLVRGFRAGRELEDTIETTMAAIKQASQQPKPDPEQMKAQAQMAQADQQHQQTMQQSDQQHQQKMAIDAKQGEMKLALEQAKMAAHEQQHQQTMQAGERQAQMAEEQHARDQEAAGLQAQRDEQKHNHDMTAKHEDRETAREQGAIKARETAQANEGKAAERKDKAAERQSADAEGAGKTQNEESNASVLAEVVKYLAAPKKIVRGPDGQASHIEVIQVKGPK